MLTCSWILSDLICCWRFSSSWYVNGFSSSSDSKTKAISNLLVKCQESNSRSALGRDVLISSRGALLRKVLRASSIICVCSLHRTHKLNAQFGCLWSVRYNTRVISETTKRISVKMLLRKIHWMLSSLIWKLYKKISLTLNYLLTYLLTPWSRVLLEKLTGSAASQEIPRIFGTRRFLTVLTSACHLSLSWANSVQSPQPPPTSRRSILILSSHLRLTLYIYIYIHTHTHTQVVPVTSFGFVNKPPSDLLLYQEPPGKSISLRIGLRSLSFTVHTIKFNEVHV